MKSLPKSYLKSPLVFLFAAAVWAQSAAPPPLPPDTVIATFEDGRKITAGELQSFLAAMPPNMAQAARRDRKKFVEQYALMHRLSEMAEKAALDRQSPTREALAFNRMYLLMNAQLHEVLTTINVPPAEVQSFYDANKQRYTQVKVKALYVKFAANTSTPTEADAQTKILKLRAAVASGADFVKVIKENSDDPTSAAKDGDFGTLRTTDNLPDAIRNAVFSLKQGELSEPVKQPNGFYLFRAEQVTAQPLSEVQTEVVNEVKQAHFKQWMEEVTRGLNLKVQNEAFFTEGGGAAPGGR